MWALRDKEQTLKDLYNVKKCINNPQVYTEKGHDMMSLVWTHNDTVIQYSELLLTQEISSDS